MTAEREETARKSLVEKLRGLFDIKEEVVGSWPLDQRPLRLDLLLRPNAKAKALGLDVDAIGVEIKDPESKESVKKLLDCVIQAYTYTFCEFDDVRPSFVLIYPEIEKFFIHDWHNKYSKSEKEKPIIREMNLLKRLMQRANVGELIISEDKYIFKFASSRFFDSKKGRSKVAGLGLNRYVGSQISKT